jgi:hypothetical protein
MPVWESSVKIKVILLSFLITTVLSLNFVVPQLVREHLQAYISDIQKSVVQYGLVLDFEDVRLSYIPLRIRVNELNLKTADGGKIFSTSRIDFSNWSFSELVSVFQGESTFAELSKLKISIQQLEFDENYLSPKLQMAMKELGYEKLILNVVSDYNYQVESKTLLLNELSIEGHKMGKLSLSAHLMDFVIPSAADLKDLATFDQSSVKSFALEYTDESLVRNIKLLADKNNVPLDRYIALSKKIEGNRDPASAQGSDITQELQKFVNDPKSVRLAVSPEKEIPFKDISLMMMLSPNKLIESLQPKIEINGAHVQIYPGN